jgi:hypothetical protein
MELQKEKLPSTFFGIRVSAIVEIICFFIICLIISVVASGYIDFFKVCPHPFWIVVILISAQYGTYEGLLAAFVATVVYLLGPLPARDLLQEKALYFYDIAKTPLAWFVSALILGELRMRHIRERDRLREAAVRAEEKQRRVAESYQALKKIKERLEVHVASELPTALMLIDSFKELEGKDLAEIIEGATGLIKALIDPEKFSVYLLEWNRLNLRSSMGWDQNDHFAKEFALDTPLYESIVNRHHTLVISSPKDVEILQSEGVLAAPIVDTNSKKVYGMIKVELMPFIRLKMPAVECIRVVGEWVGISCSRIGD